MLCGNDVFVAWLIYFNFMRIISSFFRTLTSNLIKRNIHISLLQDKWGIWDILNS
jgi:hypothetical protein